jgi:hypothetical protein
MNSSQKCACYVLVTNEKYEKLIIFNVLTWYYEEWAGSGSGIFCTDPESPKVTNPSRSGTLLRIQSKLRASKRAHSETVGTQPTSDNEELDNHRISQPNRSRRVVENCFIMNTGSTWGWSMEKKNTWPENFTLLSLSVGCRHNCNSLNSFESRPQHGTETAVAYRAIL